MESRCLPVALLALLIACPSVAASQGTTAQSSGDETIAPTEIAADLGGCSALITVTGSNSKPVFNAKVSTRIRYGLFGTKKLDLEVYTSASGQVKIVGLPDPAKRPISFQIGKGEKLETLEFKPDSSCQGIFNVQLK